MAEVTWTPRASRELNSICEYIARDSQANSRAFLAQVAALVRDIPRMPLLGSIVPEYDDEAIRERLHGSYRILYRVRSDAMIDIIALCHGARPLPKRPPV